MVDVNDDAKDKYRRVEVLTGPGRRRRWSADEKALIVAETLVPRARGSRAALADLFAAGIWSATHNAAGLVERGWNDHNAWLRSDRDRSHSVATVQRATSAALGIEVKLAVRWFGSRPAWMMLLI